MLLFSCLEKLVIGCQSRASVRKAMVKFMSIYFSPLYLLGSASNPGLYTPSIGTGAVRPSGLVLWTTAALLLSFWPVDKAFPGVELTSLLTVPICDMAEKQLLLLLLRLLPFPLSLWLFLLLLLLLLLLCSGGACLPTLLASCSNFLVPARVPGLVSLLFWHPVPSSFPGSR